MSASEEHMRRLIETPGRIAPATPQIIQVGAEPIEFPRPQDPTDPDKGAMWLIGALDPINQGWEEIYCAEFKYLPNGDLLFSPRPGMGPFQLQVVDLPPLPEHDLASLPVRRNGYQRLLTHPSYFGVSIVRHEPWMDLEFYETLPEDFANWVELGGIERIEAAYQGVMLNQELISQFLQERRSQSEAVSESSEEENVASTAPPEGEGGPPETVTS